MQVAVSIHIRFKSYHIPSVFFFFFLQILLNHTHIQTCPRELPTCTSIGPVGFVPHCHNIKPLWPKKRKINFPTFNMTLEVLRRFSYSQSVIENYLSTFKYMFIIWPHLNYTTFCIECWCWSTLTTKQNSDKMIHFLSLCL